MPNEPARQRTLRVVLIALGVVLLALIGLFLLRQFAVTLLLIFAGTLLGVFLHGCAVLLRKWFRLPHPLALGVAVLLLVGSAVLFGWLAGPQAVQQVQALTEQLPRSLSLLEQRLQGSEWGRAIVASLPSLSSLQVSFAALLGSVTQAFSITLEVVGAIVFIFFVGLYLAASPELYQRGVLCLLPHAQRPRGREVLAALGLALRWWLLGRAVTMALMGLLTWLALWLAGVPLALVLGIIAGLLLFVPYLGAILAAIPAMLVGLIESPAKALWIGVIYVGVHVFEGYCVTPFVQKRAVSLPPALLLSVQVLASALFGTIGVIFSTPLAVVGVVLLQTLYLHDVLGDEVEVLGEH
ncbi:MAG: AI-2E family transporter [Chthoniobacterales bacterium]